MYFRVYDNGMVWSKALLGERFSHFSIPSRPLRIGIYREDKENQGPASQRSDDPDSDEDGPILYRDDEDDSMEDEGE